MKRNSVELSFFFVGGCTWWGDVFLCGGGCSWVYENGKVRWQYHDNLMDLFVRDYFPSMNLLLRVSNPFGVQLSVVAKRKI